ncbi:ABC transporter substrate-binding protein [Virgibacillus oceani]
MKHKNERLWTVIIMIISIFIISGCTSNSEPTEGEAEAGEDSVSGELRVAHNAQPPTLDPHMTTAGVTSDMSRIAFETLVTVDMDYQPIPMLAESVEESDENDAFTFHLREGVTFHNGKEMTAEDVVASMNRWLENSAVANEAFGDAEFEEIDEYKVVLELEGSSSIALDVLASKEQFAAIMPKEVIDEADPEGVNELIGTGPYEFAEWAQDQYVHFTKFDDYQPLDEPADGLGGKKEALVKDIYFDIVTDASTRVAGIQTGEYDIAFAIAFENYEQLAENPDINLEPVYTSNMDLIYNKGGGLMEDVTMRKAVNAAIDIDDILQASFSDEALFLADSGYMSNDIRHWASDAGSEMYNENDPEKAQQLFDEAGYDGEEIVIMTTRDYEHYYNASVVISEQLEQIGINTSLEVYDWPTIVDRREDPEAWDLFVNAFPFKSDPTQLLQINSDFAGGVEDPTVVELLHAIRTSPSQEDAQEYWNELQEYAWTEFLPITKLGTFASIYAISDDVEGFTVGQMGPMLWNTSVVE